MLSQAPPESGVSAERLRASLTQPDRPRKIADQFFGKHR